MDMICRAGTPIFSISSDALKKESRVSGNRFMTIVPTIMIPTAITTADFRASSMRDLFLAP